MNRLPKLTDSCPAYDGDAFQFFFALLKNGIHCLFFFTNLSSRRQQVLDAKVF